MKYDLRFVITWGDGTAEQNAAFRMQGFGTRFTRIGMGHRGCCVENVNLPVHIGRIYLTEPPAGEGKVYRIDVG